jgi:hypothetical protein
MATIKGQSAGGGAAAGWVYVTDAATSGAGTVTSKVWQDSPGNTVLQSFTSSSADIRLSIRASYPVIDVGGTGAQLARDLSGGYYSGQVDITVAGSGDVVVRVFSADNVEGDRDTVAVTVDVPPVITGLSFTGGYPGSQTELKAGDSFQLTGTTDKPIDQVRIEDYEALQAADLVASGTAFTVTGTIADRGDVAVSRPGRVRVRDAATGAYSAAIDTDALGGAVDGTDVVLCNNTYPLVGIGAVTYPGFQEALKGSETATVINSVSFNDTVLYDSPNSQLSVTNPTVEESPKTVQRIGGGYNVTADNLRITANRAANDATTVGQAVVKIANIATSVTVATPAARLRSGGNDGTVAQNHTITLTADQLLLSAPTLDADVGSSGTFLGSWAGAGASWTRTLQVHDDDSKGTKTWQGLVATNLAGLVTNTITSGSTYVLGGFVARNLTFGIFQQATNLNVAVVTYTKLTAGIFTATDQPALLNPTQNDTSDIVDTYTVLSPIGSKPQAVWWNDVTQANANSSGTAQITNLEETV